MESILLFITKVAPFVFFGVITLLVIAKLCTTYLRNKVKGFEKQLVCVQNETERLQNEFEDARKVVDKVQVAICETKLLLKEIEDMKNPTKDDPAVVALSEHLKNVHFPEHFEKRVYQFPDRLDQLQEAIHEQLGAIEPYSKSSFWKLIEYIGNFDRFQGRRQS